MIASPTIPRIALLLLFGAAIPALSTSANGSGSEDITAASGRTSKDYVRTRRADGSFTPESYVFGNGGPWRGATPDSSLDKLSFLNVAHMIASPLSRQSYIPSIDPKSTILLIMVYWGTTHSPTDSGLGAEQLITWWQIDGSLGPDIAVMGAKIARNLDKSNAMMLGYDSWWDATQGENNGTAIGHERQDLYDEMEEHRYFVVLMAYDFQILWKERKHKLLWETRFSICQRHHQFDRDLPAMAQYAARYFGQDSKGLIRKPIPLGHVGVGVPTSIGEVPEK